MAKLILRDGGGGKEFDLEKSGSLTVGRSPDCDISIDDTQASRRHCQVAKSDGGFEVSDLGSTNGTLVNSTLVKKQRLKHGDVIRIGAVEISFDDPSSAGTSGPAVGYLVHAKGDKKGQKVELSAQRTTIGRKATNTIVVEDAVSSSYHCEIVRGLNGYTIRDLGSTNGTLVNSEMITEAQLAHGARIRVGNTRFVFEDPAMAAIDLELAGAEDEDEWGMMRDIDLAAVRKRNPATIVYTVLFLAIVGAGGYFLWKGKPAQAGGVIEAVRGNEIDDYSFERETAGDGWRSDPDGAVRVGLSVQVHGQGNQSVELRSGAAVADVRHARVGGDHVRYRLKGMAAARGGKASLGLLWTGGEGLERWVTVPVTGSSLSSVELVTSAPPWAQGAFPGFRMEGEGTVYVDDLSLVREGEPQVAEVKPNEFRIDTTDGTWLDVFHSTAPILVNGRAFVRDGEGKDVFAPGLKIKAEAQDAEHVLVTVEGAGNAPVAGILLEEVAGYLSRGGFRAFTPGFKNEKGDLKEFHPAFPDDGQVLTDVRKLLFGSGGRSFAVVPVEGGRLDALARVDGTRRRVALMGQVTDGRFAYRFKVDLRGEKRDAETAMADARELHAQKKWGDFLVKGPQALGEYPFADKTQRDELDALIRAVKKDYDDRCARIDRYRKEYKSFKDPRDLEAAMSELAELERVFQIQGGEGPKGQYLTAAKTEVEALDKTAREQRETAIAQPTYLNATLVDLRKDPPAVHSAAYQLYFIATFLPNSKYAPQARTKLAEIYKNHPEIERVLEKLGVTPPPPPKPPK